MVWGYVTNALTNAALSGIPIAVCGIPGQSRPPDGYYIVPVSQGSCSITVNTVDYQYFSLSGFSVLSAPVLKNISLTPTGHVISLSGGWNFISLPVTPSNPSIDTVLSGISSHVRIVWGFDNLTKVWKKWIPGGDHNSLDTMEGGKGYWLYLDSGATLVVSGSPGGSLSLTPGWNLVGYSGTDNTALSTALNSISSKWESMWAWSQGLWSMKHAIYEGLPLSVLDHLHPDRAYWIKLKQGAGETQWGW
jgi:hypothetical protein